MENFNTPKYKRFNHLILTRIPLLTNESYLPLQKIYGLNEKLFEFEIQAKKYAKIQAKKDFEIQAKKDFQIQAKKDAEIKAKKDFQIQAKKDAKILV